MVEVRRATIGWDIGGAHVKAARAERGKVVDAAQWPCPLWQGLQHLDAALARAAERWGDLAAADHAATMTGELADVFADRADGVARIAARLAAALPAPHLFAADGRWVGAGDAAAVAAAWPQIASANWLACARHAARVLAPRAGLLLDIGSTTTDIVAFGHGSVPSTSRSDADRLACGELVYHGVVRTPLCALARRIVWDGRERNVMNEFFATTADVYRLTGELDAAHDQHPAADGGAKDCAGTQARLARMVGVDARDGSPAQWLAFAQAWRAAQVAELRGQCARVIEQHGLLASREAVAARAAPVAVAAGCGAFLARALLPPGWAVLDYAQAVAGVAAPAVQAWARVAAPAVAVALLRQGERS